MITPITKAVFPVAGLGTRFLPATKASPKEMLPLVDKPLIQYVVEEAISSGIENCWQRYRRYRTCWISAMYGRKSPPGLGMLFFVQRILSRGNHLPYSWEMML